MKNFVNIPANIVISLSVLLATRSDSPVIELSSILSSLYSNKIPSAGITSPIVEKKHSISLTSFFL